MALGHLTEQELLTLLRQGDEAAFSELYDRFRPRIRKFALRICRSPEAADEIVQNVLLKLWNARQDIHLINNLPGWISRVTSNEAFDFLKRLAREKALSEQLWKNMQEQPDSGPDSYVLKDYMQIVDQAIKCLPPQQQRIYRLSREQYLTYDQIAEELGLSSHTVRNHMAAALDNIRKHLARHALHAIPPAIAALVICGKL